MFTRATITLALLIGLAIPTMALAKVEIELSIPELNTSPYHRPYVAVWLETPERQYVTTIALWADDMEWYKDLRQWWRKAGRAKQSVDGVTGATKKPGQYKITWLGKDLNGQTVAPGNYLLKVEASREEGGREFIKSKISINQNGKISLDGKRELGPITVSIQAQE